MNEELKQKMCEVLPELYGVDIEEAVCRLQSDDITMLCMEFKDWMHEESAKGEEEVSL